MKKIFAVILAILVLVSCFACTKTNDDNTGDDAIIAPAVADGTAGSALWSAFTEKCAAEPDASTEDIAKAVIANCGARFSPVVVPLEDGQEYFTGFDNTQITGYESGTAFMPMIGSIPFVGYVFRLADGADVQAFIDTLVSSANPSWNICVTADQTVAGAVGNTVLFVMTPRSFEKN